MKQLMNFSVLIILLTSLNCVRIKAQMRYYWATGKDSITYLSTNQGTFVLRRDSSGKLIYHSSTNIPVINFTRGLDNDKYLILAASNRVLLYSLENKLSPAYVGELYLPNAIAWIRPFGDHFALLTGGIQHYIVGFESDSFRVLSSIYARSKIYSNSRTLWYPEVVYPFFFKKELESSNYIQIFKFIDTTNSFLFIDSINASQNNYYLWQMFGGREFLYTRVSYNNGNSIDHQLIKISNNNTFTYYRCIQQLSIPHYFIDEIEATDTIIRQNGSYQFHDTNKFLKEPKGYLTSSANLAGANIYQTSTWTIGGMSNLEFRYSTKIKNDTIYSLMYIHQPNKIVEFYNEPLFMLHQNYPNPFNPSTTIRYQVPQASIVSLKIYDVLGNEVATLANNEYREAGTYSTEFNTDKFKLSSGVYFYRMQAGKFSATKKLILMK